MIDSDYQKKSCVLFQTFSLNLTYIPVIMLNFMNPALPENDLYIDLPEALVDQYINYFWMHCSLYPKN